MKSKMGWRGRMLLVGMILTAVAALPTTVIFFVGMMPTIVSRIADKSGTITRVLTVGFMNFAACFPFWFELMQKGHKFDNAIDIITDPVTIIVMYLGAGAGYVIEWVLSSIVAGIMVGRGRKRLDDIQEMQSELIARWGHEVNGEVPLDPQGFPMEQQKS